jgi:hypothetical protein
LLQPLVGAQERNNMADDSDKEPGKLDKKALLKRIRERCTAMIEGDRENREDAKADIRFVSVPV